MELRHRDSAGRIDYEAIKADAVLERRKAIDAFWRAIYVALARGVAKLRGQWQHAGEPSLR